MARINERYCINCQTIAQFANEGCTNCIEVAKKKADIEWQLMSVSQRLDWLRQQVLKPKVGREIF